MADKNADLAMRVVDMYIGRIKALGDITFKKMFGGYGVFESGTMFALVPKDCGVFLKAGQLNMDRFEESGANKHKRMPYYQIPEDVYRDDSQLLAWTREAIEVSKVAN